MDLQLAADQWRSGGTASSAVRYIRPVLKWAGKRDLVAMDTAMLDQPRPVAKGDRVLSPDELAKLLPVLEAYKSLGRPSVHAAALRFILLTATRRDEACGATWGEITDGVWTIPSHKQAKERAKDTAATRNIKSKFQHAIPLCKQAIALPDKLRPKDRAPAALIFGNWKGKPVSQWDRVTKAIQKEAGIYGWHRHDLRRTAATCMGRLRIQPHVIEAALNHADIHSKAAWPQRLQDRRIWTCIYKTSLQRSRDGDRHQPSWNPPPGPYDLFFRKPAALHKPAYS